MVDTRVEAIDHGNIRESVWLIYEDVANFVPGDTIG